MTAARRLHNPDRPPGQPLALAARALCLSGAGNAEPDPCFACAGFGRARRGLLMRAGLVLSLASAAVAFAPVPPSDPFRLNRAGSRQA